MTQPDFLAALAAMLETAGIPYMIAGSLGSSLYGRPRTTRDVDVVIDPSPEQLERFLALITDEWYISPEAAREALARRSMFNIIDFAEGHKADLIIRKDRPFSQEEFRRRQVRPWHGRPLPWASAEDVLLTKLEWNRITPSERQVEDAFHVALTQGKALDRGYLRHWAPALGVADSLEEVLRQADEWQRRQP